MLSVQNKLYDAFCINDKSSEQKWLNRNDRYLLKITIRVKNEEYLEWQKNHFTDNT